MSSPISPQVGGVMDLGLPPTARVAQGNLCVLITTDLFLLCKNCTNFLPNLSLRN